MKDKWEEWDQHLALSGQWGASKRSREAYKAALRAEIEKEIENCTYHPAKFGLHRALELLNTVTPIE